ncbi:MAG TPA: hypothetical protein VEA63_04165, partial [Opitutus sp.]|nr:hypothetical protein [Opitutus sp.]
MNPAPGPLNGLFGRRPELRSCETSIVEAFETLRRCFEREGRVYLCGNGGSGADCEHWAGELLKGFRAKRSPR